MPESLAHMNYVRKIVEYAQSNINLCDKVMFLVDLPEYRERPPHIIGGYIPDLYHRNKHCIIIGEAKTDNDIENGHTEAQINCYIEETRCYNIERHIVLCSSIYSFAVLNNMIIRKKIKENINDITFHILDNNSKVAII